jgi:hypothetical protein
MLRPSAELDQVCPRGRYAVRNVGWLQIAMNDWLFVGGFETCGNLICNVEGFKRNRAALDPVTQRFPSRELHYEEVRPARFLDTVNPGNVGVIDLCQNLSFATEAGYALQVLGESFRKDFQCHFARQLVIAGTIHLAHAACAEMAQDLGMV